MSENQDAVIDAKPSSFRVRENPPPPGRKLNGKTVIFVTFIFSAICAVVLVSSLSRKPKETLVVSAAAKEPSTSEVIKELPSNYAELAKRAQKPAEKKGFKRNEGVRELSPEEKLFEELRLQKLKRALLARESEIAFTNIKAESAPPSQRGAYMGSTSLGGGLSFEGQEGAGGAASSLNPRDMDTRQDEKREFLERERKDSTTLSQTIKAPVSSSAIMAGTIIPGILLTGINSDLPGQLLGQVSQAVFDSVTGRILLIPQGTKIIGTYDSEIVYGQERVLIVWTRLIFPNGNSISLEGMPGVDLSGYAGLSDKVNNHYLKLLTGVVFGSVLGAGAQVAAGIPDAYDPNFQELAAQGAAKNINDVGQQITRKNLAIQPTLEVSPGHRFNVFVTKDVVLEPYEG